MPKEVRKGEVSGRVVAQFVIDKAGGIEDIEIVKSLSPACGGGFEKSTPFFTCYTK